MNLQDKAQFGVSKEGYSWKVGGRRKKNHVNHRPLQFPSTESIKVLAQPFSLNVHTEYTKFTIFAPNRS